MGEQYDILFLVIAKSAFLFWLVCLLVEVLADSFIKAIKAMIIIYNSIPKLMSEHTGV